MSLIEEKINIAKNHLTKIQNAIVRMKESSDDELATEAYEALGIKSYNELDKTIRSILYYADSFAKIEKKEYTLELPDNLYPIFLEFRFKNDIYIQKIESNLDLYLKYLNSIEEFCKKNNLLNFPETAYLHSYKGTHIQDGIYKLENPLRVNIDQWINDDTYTGYCVAPNNFSKDGNECEIIYFTNVSQNKMNEYIINLKRRHPFNENYEFGFLSNLYDDYEETGEPRGYLFIKEKV